MVDAVKDQGARHVLDIGCGTGATTIAIGRAIAGRGHATGADLSVPMIELAGERARACGVDARFIAGDASRIAANTPFDMAVSRFGIMFFDDPVAAFEQIRAMLLPDAPLTAFAWRSPKENPFMTCAERTAAPMLPPLPPQQPDAPGQFAFAAADRVRTILADAGWSRVVLTPFDVECTMPVARLDAYLLHMGRVGIALNQLDDAPRTALLAQLRRAFAPFVDGDRVRFTAACWRIDARA
ncbi:class I SAM-dependent methyltransferase [Sphingomonas sp. CCH9-H8]|uniref:class I SAM-dependent methyltransferase n=1 Tax=Sphingomonas sp. CCH9-H8 TaxID=1768772 RepID=UPI0018D23394|nr:class I SAM-dependent methyltransferase [Sphingomonas sp. CCH9-H8]